MVRLDLNPLPSVVDEEAADDPELLPTNLYSDEPPLETDFHRRQIDLLIRLLEFWWRDGQSPAPKGYRPDFYISGNLTVYYNKQQLKKRDFRGPDVFVVLDAEKRDRHSWVIWEEGGKYPNVVIELLSNSTATVDRGAKKKLYQDVWRVPNYFWFHPETMEFAGFHLVNGRYEAIAPTDTGWLWSDQLELFLGIHERQLRWFNADGDLIPLPEEAERQRADQEQHRAEQERRAKERLESYLRSQGIDPNQLPE
jgi:Uma2 family endonuclease